MKNFISSRYLYLLVTLMQVTLSGYSNRTLTEIKRKNTALSKFNIV
ncbi:hypothetical protein [Aquimarina amphilecti]|nr:hypothetical protein [Aquimarina amphilecti]